MLYWTKVDRMGGSKVEKTKVWVWAGLLLAAAGLCLCLAGPRLGGPLGARAEGWIVSIEADTAASTQASPAYRARVRFEAQSGACESLVPIPQSVYTVGQRVVVRYDPDNPARARLLEPVILPWIGGCLAAAGGCVLALSIGKGRRRRVGGRKEQEDGAVV